MLLFMKLIVALQNALVDEECFIVEPPMDDYDDNDVIEELLISDEDLKQMEVLDVPAHLQEILDVRKNLLT